jgi:hypothetical protein
MTFSRVLLGMSVLFGAGMASKCCHADIVVGTRFREVYTDAASIGFNVIDGSTNSSGGVYSDTATSVEVEPTFGTFTAIAAQNSTIPALVGPAMSGSGSVDGSAMQLVSPFVGVVNGDSVFDIRFTVDAPGTYDFMGSVSYSEVAPFGPGGAFITLGNLTTLTPLAYIQRGDTNPGSATTNLSFLLAPGNTYRLYASAIVTGVAGQGHFFEPPFVFPRTSISNASWNFTLAPTAIPEASALLTSGAASILVVGMKSKRR